jgi:RimJ/RimL family protein N-acetyltransferase
MRLINESSESAERAYDRVELPMSLADASDWLAASIKASAAGDRRAFAVLRAEDNAPLGLVDVWEANRRSGVFRTGIKLLPGEGGKGHATLAYARVLDYYFFELRYQKCGVYIYDFNQKSIHFHEKFGFAKEGRLHREYYTEGRFHDAIWYGLTVEDYRAWRDTHPQRA